ncbi:hypothetical protein, partial [Nitrospira sp. BLG_2]|uniref:hypothetical protein n=1 Tax=Nitrospira sp. BLG_2 TaxID=3397507 RepID=UPI003B9BF368
MRVFTPAILAVAVFIAAPAFAQSATDTNMEIMMQKVKADKKLLVASNMDLTDAEAKAFWPLYDEYQKELGKINQTMGNTIKEYADAFNKGPVENDTAKKLLGEALSAQESEVKLKRTYADKISKVLPWSKTARYIQIENKVRSIVNIELAKAIPLTDEPKRTASCPSESHGVEGRAQYAPGFLPRSSRRDGRLRSLTFAVSPLRCMFDDQHQGLVFGALERQREPVRMLVCGSRGEDRP